MFITFGSNFDSGSLSSFQRFHFLSLYVLGVEGSVRGWLPFEDDQTSSCRLSNLVQDTLLIGFDRRAQPWIVHQNLGDQVCPGEIPKMSVYDEFEIVFLF